MKTDYVEAFKNGISWSLLPRDEKRERGEKAFLLKKMTMGCSKPVQNKLPHNLVSLGIMDHRDCDTAWEPGVME